MLNQKKLIGLSFVALFTCAACSPNNKVENTNTITPLQPAIPTSSIVIAEPNAQTPVIKTPSLYDLKTAPTDHVYQETICSSIYAEFFNKNEAKMLSLLESGKEAWYAEGKNEINYYVRHHNNPKTGSFSACTSFEGDFEPHARTADQPFLAREYKYESCITFDLTGKDNAAYIDALSGIFNAERLEKVTQAANAPVVKTAKLCVDWGLG
ncbi:MAG: hypothetical protein VX468_04245 [Pseudomonadota bacterium]|nr:hypothetical protein [Pseudomonadota bacterium]